jgi:hypothetical protein
MGRELSEQQCTPSNCSSTTPYSLSYGYDLAGNLLSLTNGAVTVPGGTNPLVLTYTYDNAGRMINLGSNWLDTTHPANLFNASSLSVNGAWQNATYGANLSLIRTFDPRLRITGEADTSSNAPATYGTAAIAITGAENSK